jgi:site-specific DNA-methyltransferase (adenine-specific)
MIDLRNGDCIEQMRQLPPNSVDSIVTDPPYELGFMGKSWDSTGIAYSVKMWDEALRVLKPGGHLLAFSGSRTYHRMACAIEDAGFEIRDQIMWVYGSGFPKSMDVSKAIDKQAGVEREVVGSVTTNVGMQGGNFTAGSQTGLVNITAPATDKAKQWEGWGTALKPAHEPIVLARKPLIGTVATNVIIHGTGALNIDRSRVEYESLSDKEKALKGDAFKRKDVSDEGWSRPWMSDQNKIDELNRAAKERADQGRWPANFIHDGLDEDWARFFYCAKASKKDRNEGLDDFAGKEVGTKGNGLARTCATCGASTLQGCECPDRTYVNPTRANHHPTVKPTDLMRYLVRMITPPNGVVLDPFMGSGSTGKAAVLEHFSFIGIDQSADYLEIATARIKHAEQQIEGQLL